MEISPNKFIILEGPDGVGKTTIIKKLQENFDSSKYIFVKDPGCTPLGMKIRELLLDKKNSEMDPVTELMLFAASRAQMVNQVVKPALKHSHVISDRFSLSTMVYQDGVKNRGNFKEVLEFGLKDLWPDLILVLDVPPEVSLQRISGREMDRMESKGVEQFKIRREKYLEYASDMKNALILDATGPIDDVYGLVLNTITRACSQ